MASRKIYITDNDAKRLRELLRLQITKKNNKDLQNLRILETELRRATIVQPNEVRPDVVTMNSRIIIECGPGNEPMDCTLVFPEEADAAAGRISVVAPIGAAVLGYRVGDRIPCTTPGGKLMLVIKEILFQPEALGTRS